VEVIGRSLVWLSINWKFFTFGFLSIYPVLLVGYFGQEAGLLIAALGLYVLVLIIVYGGNYDFFGTPRHMPRIAFSRGLVVNSLVLLLGSLFTGNAMGYIWAFALFLVGFLTVLVSDSD
jgi:hypothetical protein